MTKGFAPTQKKKPSKLMPLLIRTSENLEKAIDVIGELAEAIKVLNERVTALENKE